MTHSETLTLLTDALTLTERWSAPLAGHDIKLSRDGLEISYESDPDVGGWSGVADAANAGIGGLLTALLRTGAVEHLQQTLRTAITIVTETGVEGDPAVTLGVQAAREVLTIATSLAAEDERRRKFMENTAAAVGLEFERLLNDNQPALQDIDRNIARGDRDDLRKSIDDLFGQSTS